MMSVSVLLCVRSLFLQKLIILDSRFVTGFGSHGTEKRKKFEDFFLFRVVCECERIFDLVGLEGQFRRSETAMTMRSVEQRSRQGVYHV